MKKVPVGSSPKWLVKVLREVKNMETVQVRLPGKREGDYTLNAFSCSFLLYRGCVYVLLCSAFWFLLWSFS